MRFIGTMRRLGCFVIIPILLPQFISAQSDRADEQRLGLVISTSIDTAKSDSGALRNQLGKGQGEAIVISVNQRCLKEITSLLDDQDIMIPVIVGDSDLAAYGHVTKWVYLFNMISVDRWGSFMSRSELLFTDRLRPLLALKQELEPISARHMDTIIESLAARVSRDVSEMVADWLVESLYKIRVVVTDFDGSQLDTVHAFLGRALKTMAESELAKNEAFLVYSAGDGRSGDAMSEAYANYQISGSYFCLENSIRVDIQCLKTRSGRILLSRSITHDTLSLSKLSGDMALAMNRMKKAMLAEDRKVNRTLAVVAEPPTRYFRSRGVPEDAFEMARLFRRNIANRLRRFMQLQGEPANGRRLEILNDTDALDRYLESYHDPGEIISDLATDYVIILKIEDLGQRVRVAATMHSYSTDSLIFGDLIYGSDDSKARFRNLIDRTLLRIAGTLCDLGFLADAGSVICETDVGTIEEKMGKEGKKHEDSLIAAINEYTRDVRVLDIRVNKGFGFRGGGVLHHDDKLFLGRGSSVLVEVFYSYLLPQQSWTRSWMALEMETSVNLDCGGGTIFRHGLTGLQLLLELRLIITSLRYTDLPVTIGLGGGVGVGGIGMQYDAHEAPYAGSRDLDNGAYRGLVAASAHLDFPVTEWLRLQLLLRRVYQLGSAISSFEGEPFDAGIEGPVKGKVDSRHILVGLKMVFR